MHSPIDDLRGCEDDVDELTETAETVIAAAEEAVAAAPHGDQLLALAMTIAIAALLGLGFIRLRQPPLVGFILAGLLLGPTGFGVIDSSESVALLAELGVVLLLFFIGMELSIRAFIVTIRQAVLVAAGQLVASMALASVIAWGIGATVAEAVILGFIIALSSTVVAMKMLDSMGELRTSPGRVAVGVLIAQDLAVVPMLILVSSFGGESFNIWTTALKMVFAVGLLAGLLWWFGKHPKLRVPFAQAVEDNVELLALGALGVCFTAAALSSVAGLSPVYGAFLAGLIVGNSQLRSRVIPVIEPIQSVLLVVFFLSIGLLIDPDYIVGNFWLVLAASLAVIAAKTVLNIFLLRITGADAKTALLAGLSMAQIGEFSFVLAAAGLATGAFGADIQRLAIAVIAVSLLVSPIWFNMMERIEHIASQRLGTYREALAAAYEDEAALVDDAVWNVRARYRALRFALYQRRTRKAAARAGEAADEATPGEVEGEERLEEKAGG